MLNVIDYAPGNTALHKLHPVAKVALAAEQRGFYLRTRESSYLRYPFTARDCAALAFCVALIALGVAF